MFSTSKRALVALFIAHASVHVGCAAVVVDDPEAVSSTVAAKLSAPDAAKVLALVNYPGTDEALLDHQVRLDARAARNIIAHRDGDDAVSPSADDQPFADLAALDAIAYVGDAAFSKLRSYALSHPAPTSELVEGVAFSGWQSEAVVWGVDHVEESVLDSMLDTRAAQALFAHRPYASVAQMGPIAYVGKSALEHLLAQSTTWWTAMHAPVGPSCIATFDALITSHLKDVLFMSESDRVLTLVSYPGAGAAAPTAASVLALVGAPAGSTALLRDPASYYSALEPASSTADGGAAAAIQAAFTAQLHDVVYVAVFAPKGSIDDALVNVYLVGRSSCGDLVGLTAIAVET